MSQPEQRSTDASQRPARDHWVVAALIGLPWLYEVARCAAVYLQVPLPRDPMIFQYTAWAVRQGDLLYRDILDVNGPLITWIHLAFQALGGETGRGLRWLDLAAGVIVFATVGATLPSAVSRRDQDPVRIDQRVAWAFTTVIVLLCAYFSFNFWDAAQRDGLYFLWILLSSALQVEAMGRSNRALLCLAGVLSGVTWLGKPTFVLFTLAQAVPLWLEGADRRARVRSVLWFVAAAWLGALGFGLLSTTIADMPRWLHLLRHDVPVMYRHVHAMTFSALWQGLRGWVALLSLAQGIVLFLCARKGVLPLRALVVGVLPLPALGNIALQSKGYFYHYDPLWMALGLQWLLLVATAWAWLRNVPVVTRGAQVIVVAFTALVSAAVGLNLFTSTYAYLDTLITPGHPAAGDAQLRLKLFSQRDSMLLDEHVAGQYLAQVTTPDQRIQVFGMDPGVLFLARRRSATPYIYSFDLVLDESLKGATLRGVDAAGLQKIREMGDARRHDFLRRLRQRPPAKIVFPARADFLPDAPEATFRAQLSDAATWLDAHYQLEANVGTLRVYGLRTSAD